MTKKNWWAPGLALRSRHGAALCKSGEYVTAEAELAEVIRRRSATAGPGDPILIHARRWHLHALGKVGRLADAEDDLRFLAEAAARLHGDGHRDVLAYRERHAASLWEAGRRDEAVTEMAEVAARRALALGDDHADTVRAARSLAAMTSGDEGYRFGFETAGLRGCALTDLARSANRLQSTTASGRTTRRVWPTSHHFCMNIPGNSGA
jgi:Tetratricopeptide repeat